SNTHRHGPGARSQPVKTAATAYAVTCKVLAIKKVVWWGNSRESGLCRRSHPIGSGTRRATDQATRKANQIAQRTGVARLAFGRQWSFTVGTPLRRWARIHVSRKLMIVRAARGSR